MQLADRIINPTSVGGLGCFPPSNRKNAITLKDDYPKEPIFGDLPQLPHISIMNISETKMP